MTIQRRAGIRVVLLMVLALLALQLPGTVYAVNIVSTVNIVYDVADFQLYTGSIEKDVDYNIRQKTETTTTGIMILRNTSKTGLMYRIDKTSYGGTNASTNKVVETRNYYMCVRLRLTDDYDWPAKISQLAEHKDYIPLTELSEFKVFLNGRGYSGDGYVRYYNGTYSEIDIGIPIANDIVSIILSPNSFTYDGKAKIPDVVSARLKNGDLVNGRMYDVFYVDANDRDITPINPGTYYVLLKGTGIYGTGRKAFTIEGGSEALHVHIWDSGTITTQPTATSPGIKIYTCTVCGETKTEVIPKLKITVPWKPSMQKPVAGKTRITVKWKHFRQTSKKQKKIWKKIRKVQVQCAADKTFRNNVKTTTAGKSKTKAAIRGLKKNTTYYVRVRYFDGTGYSKWSSVKKIKTKKN